MDRKKFATSFGLRVLRVLATVVVVYAVLELSPHVTRVMKRVALDVIYAPEAP